MKKIKKILLILVTLMLLAFTGCANQNYELVVNSDDSARFTIKYIVDKDTYDSLSSYDIDMGYTFEQSEKSTNPIERCNVLFQEIASVFHEQGFEIKDINDSVNIGFEATKNYATIEELNKDIKSLYDKKLIKLNGEVSISDSLLNKTYLFSGSVEYLLDPDAEVSEEDKKQLLDLYDASGLEATVSMKMPGNLVAHDGTIEDSMAKYKVTYNDNKEVPVHLKTSIPNTLVRNIIMITIVVLVFVGIILGSRYAKKKKEEKKRRELYGDEDQDDNEY